MPEFVQIFFGTLPILIVLVWGVISNEYMGRSMKATLARMEPLLRGNKELLELIDAKVKLIKLVGSTSQHSLPQS